MQCNKVLTKLTEIRSEKEFLILIENFAGGYYFPSLQKLYSKITIRTPGEVVAKDVDDKAAYRIYLR